MTLEERVNELAGSIKKEQYRMIKAGEVCSGKHTTFLDTICYTLFDISDALSNGDIKENNYEIPNVSNPVILEADTGKKTVIIDRSIPKLEPVYKEPISEPMIEQEKESIIPEPMTIPEYVSEAEDDYILSTEEAVPEETIDSVQTIEENMTNVSSFTYSYQKFRIRRNGVKDGEIHISAFPLTTSKEEAVSIPIVASVYRDQSVVNLSSFDNADGHAMLTCDYDDITIGIRGYIDNKGDFHVSITSKTEGCEVIGITSNEVTNRGDSINILSDTWEDKMLYGFPLDLNKNEFLIVAKSDIFTDYSISSDEKVSAPFIAYENDEERSKKAFINCQPDEQNKGYEFVLKEI